MIRLAKRPVSRRNLDQGIVPMINVVFLLLLFFIVAGNLGEVEHPDISLPASVSERLAAKQQTSLFLTQNGELLWGQRTIRISELPALISGTVMEPGNSFRLKVDARARAHYLIPVMDELKKNKVERLAIITVQSEQGG